MTIYIPTLVTEELPKGDQWVTVMISVGGMSRDVHYQESSWFFQGVFYNNTFYEKKISPTHWLKPIEVDVSDEAIEKMICEFCGYNIIRDEAFASGFRAALKLLGVTK